MGSSVRGVPRGKEHPSARVHEADPESEQAHGASDGLFNVVATTKGGRRTPAPCSGVEIGEAREGRDADRHAAPSPRLRALGDEFPTLVYDGALTPVSWQELMAQYGVFCVNANYARKAAPARPRARRVGAKNFDPGSATTGEGSRKYGRRRNTKKATYVTHLPR